MQKLKFFSILFISLFLFNLCQGQEEYVIRITATNCSYLNGTPGTTNTLSGFILNGKGVMTALHGVCGCRTIVAEDANGRDLGNLEIVQADLGNDVALLTSERIRSGYQNKGLEYSTLAPNSLSDQPVTLIGFGYGIARPKRTTSCKVRKPATIQLINGVMSGQKEGLSNRSSPDLYNDILDVDMAIPPGCSGAPILYNNKVIGIADGGLAGGSTNYCWAIPVNNIQLAPISSLGSKYSELKEKNPEKIFVLTANLDKDKSREEKPAKKKILTARDAIDALKTEPPTVDLVYKALSTFKFNNKKYIAAYTASCACDLNMPLYDPKDILTHLEIERKAYDCQDNLGKQDMTVRYPNAPDGSRSSSRHSCACAKGFFSSGYFIIVRSCTNDNNTIFLCKEESGKFILIEKFDFRKE